MFAEEGVLVGMGNVKLVEEEEEKIAGFNFGLEGKTSVLELGGGDVGHKELGRGCLCMDMFPSRHARMVGLSSGFLYCWPVSLPRPASLPLPWLIWLISPKKLQRIGGW